MICRVARAHPAVAFLLFVGLIVSVPPVSAAIDLKEPQVFSLLAIPFISYIAWLWAIAVLNSSHSIARPDRMMPTIAMVYLLLYFGILVPFVLEPFDHPHRLGTRSQDIWHLASAICLMGILHFAATKLTTLRGAEFRVSRYLAFLVSAFVFPFGVWFIQRRLRG